jgi:hypothetical protein
MKSIELKIVKESQEGQQDQYVSTYAILRAVINSPSEGGINVEEMLVRLKLLDKLDKFKDFFEATAPPEELLQKTATLELEDNEFSKLKDLYKNMKFLVVSKFLVEISEQLNN